MTTVATNSFIHSFMRSAGGNRLARSPSILNWLGSELSLLTGRMSPQVWFKPGDDVVACIKAEVDCCCTINCLKKPTEEQQLRLLSTSLMKSKETTKNLSTTKLRKRA